MKFAIVISKKDKAGMNIARHLDELGVDYVLVDEPSIYADEEIKEMNLDCDFVIFATQHRSEKGQKSLTCHAPGNWKQADFGGDKGRICKTSARFLKLLFKVLNEEAEKKGFDSEVSMECTHHGPLIEKPCCFIEIGSNEKDWEDAVAGEIIADVIKRVVKEYKDVPKAYEPVIGIGGPHYCPNFNKIQLNLNYAVGHVIPGYILPLTKEIVQKAIDRTIEGVKKAIIDWKGCGKAADREEVIKILESCGLEVLRSDKIGNKF